MGEPLVDLHTGRLPAYGVVLTEHIVDIFAPGAQITSLWVTSNTAIAMPSGTTMAAAHITGLDAHFLALEGPRIPVALCESLKEVATQSALIGVPAGTVNLLAYNLSGLGLWEVVNSEYGNGQGFFRIGRSVLETLQDGRRESSICDGDACYGLFGFDGRLFLISCSLHACSEISSQFQRVFISSGLSLSSQLEG